MLKKKNNISKEVNSNYVGSGGFFESKSSNSTSNSNYESNYSSPKITTDFTILIKIFFEFIIYLIFLIPNLVFLTYYMVTLNKNKMNDKFDEIILSPFKILGKLHGWFFEANYTAYLILFLIFVFILEIFFFGPYMDNLQVHTSHLITGTNFYSTLTSIFLHANLFHLFSNCLALLIFGRQVEKNMSSKLIYLFIGSGLIANIISNAIAYYIGESYYSLGASGAIAGLIMFAILLEPFALTTIFIVPLPLFLIGWFLILVDVVATTLNAQSQTNHLAHISGYLALLILFFFLEFKHRKKILTGFAINLFMMGIFYLIYRIYGNLIPQFIIMLF